MEQDRTHHPSDPGKPEEREPDERFGVLHPERDGEYRPGPTWRGLAIAVIAAVMLSVGATLLLGGSFGLYARSAVGGWRSSGNCCPLPVDK